MLVSLAHCSDSSSAFRGYAGVVVDLITTVANDGATPPLGMHLQLHDSTSRYGFASAYSVPLSESAGEETSVYLPMSSFDRGSWIGYQCSNCALNQLSIDEIDIDVLFQEGDFDVKIKGIRAVDEPQIFPSPILTISSNDEVRELIVSTIGRGGSLYDYGYYELCISVYASTLNSMLTADSGVSDVVKGMICQGLSRASEQNNKGDKAWTLRYTMDGVLEHLGFSDGDDQSWRPEAVSMSDLEFSCEGMTSGESIIATRTLPPSSEPSPAPSTPPSATPTSKPSALPTAKPSTPAPTEPVPLIVTTTTTATTTAQSISTSVQISTSIPEASIVIQTAHEDASEISIASDLSTTTPASIGEADGSLLFDSSLTTQLNNVDAGSGSSFEDDSRLGAVSMNVLEADSGAFCTSRTLLLVSSFLMVVLSI